MASVDLADRPLDLGVVQFVGRGIGAERAWMVEENTSSPNDARDGDGFGIFRRLPAAPPPAR